MSMFGLKPCPFCGSPGVVIENGNLIKCTVCKVVVASGALEWNQRPAAPVDALLALFENPPVAMVIVNTNNAAGSHFEVHAGGDIKALCGRRDEANAKGAEIEREMLAAEIRKILGG